MISNKMKSRILKLLTMEHGCRFKVAREIYAGLSEEEILELQEEVSASFPAPVTPYFIKNKLESVGKLLGKWGIHSSLSETEDKVPYLDVDSELSVVFFAKSDRFRIYYNNEKVGSRGTVEGVASLVRLLVC